jgi:hypothetical protein
MQVETQDDAWRLSELRSADGKLQGLVRKRAPLPREGRDWRAWLTLHYERGRDALPNSEDMQRLAAFEDRLVEELEVAGHGVLVAVVLVDGKRDHLFYLADREVFAARLAALARDVAEYRPTLEFAPDPDWVEFEETIG